MKYKDLKEMTFKEWDGKPFRAIVIDNPEEDITSHDIKRLHREEGAFLINGYKNGCWMDDDCRLWIYAYPIDWNKKPKKRMTNRQLAMWLANGKGQMMYLSHTDLSIRSDANLTTNHMYDLCADNEECNDRIRVRNWGVEGWKEPTTDLLEEK